jgi:hypothetical protein
MSRKQWTIVGLVLLLLVGLVILAVDAAEALLRRGAGGTARGHYPRTCVRRALTEWF